MHRKTRHKLNFTKRALEALPVPAKRLHYYDEQVPGLAICLTPFGSRLFYLIRRIGQHVERVKIGAFPEWTVERARGQAELLKGQIAGGSNPADRRRAARDVPTFAEVFEQFIGLPTRTRAKRPKAEKTVIAYRQMFAAYMGTWHGRRLSDVTRGDVQRFHNRLQDKHGPYVANRVLGLIRAMYNAAIDPLEVYTVNPAARVPMFEEHERERFIQDDEFPRFWAALEAEPSEKVRDFIKLALFTGQRRTNVLAMRWEDVKIERALWTIPQTKTGRHDVPLTAAALEILERRLAAAEGSPWVFPGHHGTSHLKDPMRAWRSILARAGISNLRIHDLRRTLGSWQTKTGASRPIVGKLLGHSQEQTTAIYGRLDLEPVRKSATKATNAMLAAAKAPKVQPGKRRRKGPADSAENPQTD